MRQLFIKAIAVVLGVAFSGLVFADLAGTWALDVSTDQGSGNPTVKIEQSGNELTGTYTGQFGEAPLTGSVDGEDFKFRVSMSMQGQDFYLEYAGKATGGEMSGKIDFAGMGGGSFTGKKQ